MSGSFGRICRNRAGRNNASGPANDQARPFRSGLPSAPDAQSTSAGPSHGLIKVLLEISWETEARYKPCVASGQTFEINEVSPDGRCTQASVRSRRTRPNRSITFRPAIRSDEPISRRFCTRFGRFAGVIRFGSVDAEQLNASTIIRIKGTPSITRATTIDSVAVRTRCDAGKKKMDCRTTRTVTRSRAVVADGGSRVVRRRCRTVIHLAVTVQQWCVVGKSQILQSGMASLCTRTGSFCRLHLTATVLIPGPGSLVPVKAS